MAGKIGPLREIAIRSEPNGLGWRFTIGERFSITLVFRTEDEAKAVRKRMAEGFNDAVEVSERYNPVKR